MNNIAVASAVTVVAVTTLVKIRTSLRTKRAATAIQAGHDAWAEYVHLYNEATGTSITCHPDFAQMSIVKDF